MAVDEKRVGREKERPSEVIFATLLLAVLDLGTLFANKDAWAEKSEFFVVEHAKDGFRFASETRDIVNCLDHDSCVWYGLKVWEARVYFDKSAEEESVSRVEISLYNSGDDKTGSLYTEELHEKLDVIATHLAPKGKKPQDEKTTLKSGGLRYRRVYGASSPAAEVVWGVSGSANKKNKRVDYLRLTLLPKGGAKSDDAKARAQRGQAGKAKIRENVTKSPNGDVFVDHVPMVDQGQKGYCAAAVAERVLRYYGTRIDEHEIAQQAGTTAEGGTSVSAMKTAVTAIGEKNSLGYQEIVSMTSGGVAALEEELAKYNKAAKLEKKPEVSLAQFTTGNMIDVAAMRQAMDAKVIYRMRLKDARLKKFSAGVRQQVNAGIPVFWGVTLGIFPERGVNPQSTGGHMRLIIGYNDKKKEILYTDTWGEGHELKRMPEDWAFAITHDAFFLKPR